MRAEFGQENGDPQADRQCHHQRDQGGHQSAVDERPGLENVGDRVPGRVSRGRQESPAKGLARICGIGP